MNELLFFKIVAGVGLGCIASDIIRVIRKRRRARAITAPMKTQPNPSSEPPDPPAA